MASFQWDENYITGIDSVDSQHQALVCIINELGEMLMRASPIEETTLRALIEQLFTYTQEHFRDEEQLMQSHGIDARHFSHHQRAHQHFIQEIAILSADHQLLSRAQSMLKFLVDWLAYHILGSDQSMAMQLKMIREGHSAETAYTAYQQLGMRATEPLLVALHRLFEQVSERNRALYELTLTLESKVEERTRELALANKHLEELSLTDVLTGLPNRRHAMRVLQTEWDLHTLPLSCMMLDGDGFKQVNDTYGHEAGDQVLVSLAHCLKTHIRTDDLACRLGGDEFLIVCPHTDLLGVLHLAEQLRQKVNALRVAVGDGLWQGRISIGVATRITTMHQLDELLKCADDGVYLAKRSGRNQVATVQGAHLRTRS
ncbi:GGDEF domain-containing protein [Thiorhodospira sibirica]|uniref:GGDEF domain-containing protein n=1 Tax=Thiorhodospira sibirica TaxID=154347 RepID=UPI00022C4668|nr:GGDEF domain-containing protein [Thiorhodospira sibirica]